MDQPLCRQLYCVSPMPVTAPAKQFDGNIAHQKGGIGWPVPGHRFKPGIKKIMALQCLTHVGPPEFDIAPFGLIRLSFAEGWWFKHRESIPVKAGVWHFVNPFDL